MTRRQQIFSEGIRERIEELRDELDQIPRERNDKDKLLYDQALIHMASLENLLKLYIVTVVE